MGKPYGHQYFFAGNGGSTGDMICKCCHQPIFNHSQDWMSYQKSKSHDWSYHCFHRKCRDDQTGWEKIEKKLEKAMRKANDDRNKFIALSKSIGCEFDMELVYAAAKAVGIDLDQHFFDTYGSC